MSTEGKLMPDGYCPNCWGVYEYDNMIRVKLEDRQVDVNNHKKVKGFIEEFADKHVRGIKLKAADDSYYCTSCMTNYRKIDGTDVD